MSSTVRVAKCRTEKKKDASKWRDYLDKDKIRKRESRKKQKTVLLNNEKLLFETRKKDRERQKLQRLKQKSVKLCNAEGTSDLGTYKSQKLLERQLKKLKMCYLRVLQRERQFLKDS